MFGIDAATLGAFLAAAGALVLVPGQDTLVVLTRGLASARAGVGAALGVATGVLVHASAAALGLAALYRAVPAAATVVALAGAAYLLVLAGETLRADDIGGPDTETAANDEVSNDVADGANDARGALAGYRRGLVTNVANPKVALFFLAFLPGFAGGNRPAAMLALGGVYALLTAGYLGAVGALAGRAGTLLSGGAARAVRVGSAAALVVLAGALAASAV